MMRIVHLVMACLFSSCRTTHSGDSSVEDFNQNGQLIVGYSYPSGSNCYGKIKGVKKCAENIGLVTCNVNAAKASCQSAFYEAYPFDAFECSDDPYRYRRASCGDDQPKRLPLGPCPSDDYNKTKKPAGEMVLSDYGRGLLMGTEDFKPSLYNDDSPKKNCTIGYGHVVHMGPCDQSASEAPYLNGIDKSGAKALFDQDMASYYGMIRKYTDPLPLTQGEFDSLVSFSYNYGKKTWMRRETWKILGPYVGHPVGWDYFDDLSRENASFAAGKYLKGLENRRIGEMLLRAGFCPTKFNP